MANFLVTLPEKMMSLFDYLNKKNLVKSLVGARKKTHQTSPISLKRSYPCTEG